MNYGAWWAQIVSLVRSWGLEVSGRKKTKPTSFVVREQQEQLSSFAKTDLKTGHSTGTLVGTTYIQKEWGSVIDMVAIWYEFGQWWTDLNRFEFQQDLELFCSCSLIAKWWGKRDEIRRPVISTGCRRAHLVWWSQIGGGGPSEVFVVGGVSRRDTSHRFVFWILLNSKKQWGEHCLRRAKDSGLYIWRK